MYVAAYDENNTLKGIYIERDIQDIKSYDVIDGMTSVRIFIWDKNMKPLVLNTNN